MTCKNHYDLPLGSIGKCDCKCPKRPQEPRIRTLTFENCVPIAGPAESSNNIIFDVEPNALPVLLAATIENFSTDGINVTIFRQNGQETIAVQSNSSLTFIHADVVRVTLNDFGQDYTGSFKFQATYAFEV